MRALWYLSTPLRRPPTPKGIWYGPAIADRPCRASSARQVLTIAKKRVVLQKAYVKHIEPELLLSEPAVHAGPNDVTSAKTCWEVSICNRAPRTVQNCSDREIDEGLQSIVDSTASHHPFSTTQRQNAIHSGRRSPHGGIGRGSQKLARPPVRT